MAETSTLQLASNLPPEERLASLLDGRITSESIEQVCLRNPMPYYMLAIVGSHSVSPRNVLLNYSATDEIPFAASRIFAPEGSIGDVWQRILSAQRILERCPAEGSNYWPVWYSSHGPSFQSGVATWNATLPAAEPLSTELVDAIADIDGATGEAKEQGFPVPSQIALSNAIRLVRRLYRIAPRRFEVYPTPDAEIAIDAPGKGSSVILLCDSDGGALCMINLPDGHHTKFYPTTDTLPDGFVSEALESLVSESN